MNEVAEVAEENQNMFFSFTKDSTIRFLIAAFMVGVAWTKLTSVETGIRNLSDQLSSYAKAQEELTVNEKLLEARVLSLETNQIKNAGAKHQ